MATAATSVTAGGDECEGFLDIGQCLPGGRGQFHGDLVPGRIGGVGGCGTVDFGFEFGQLSQPEAALPVQGGSQCGESVGEACT